MVLVIKTFKNLWAMSAIEFYIFNKELWYITEGENRIVSEHDTELIGMILQKIIQFYPEAYNALCNEYKKSALNVPYYHYLMVRRFCKCNFGNLDNTRSDIDVNGNFNFECVSCPLKGECINDGVICKPKLSTKLTDAELRVMKILYEGNSYMEAASTLYLSIDTIKFHCKSVYRKLGINSLPEFIKYADKHHLFE